MTIFFIVRITPIKDLQASVQNSRYIVRVENLSPVCLFEAAKKYNIDLTESFMVGDGINDIKAGDAAGCKLVYIGNEEVEGVKSYQSVADFVSEDF